MGLDVKCGQTDMTGSYGGCVSNSEATGSREGCVNLEILLCDCLQTKGLGVHFSFGLVVEAFFKEK